MTVLTYTKAGTKATAPAKLDKAIFGLKVPNHQLLKDAYLAYLANARPNLAKTKTRGEVVGSTIKPWRQKGTGRARFGSRYNPIWTGGGVAFGPKGNENYSRKLSTKSKRQAIRQALSLAAAEGKLKIIEAVDFKEGKVKPVVALLNKIEANGKTLLVVDIKSAESTRATRNINDLKVISAKYLGVYDILNTDQLVITKPALDAVEAWLGGKDE